MRFVTNDTCVKAADEIARLREENERLKEIIAVKSDEFMRQHATHLACQKELASLKADIARLNEGNTALLGALNDAEVDLAELKAQSIEPVAWVDKRSLDWHIENDVKLALQGVFRSKEAINLKDSIPIPLYTAAPRDEQVETLRHALENCRLYAARHRKEEWATHILRFCSEAGVVGSPMRDDAARKGEE
jgi:hypothetical protein